MSEVKTYPVPADFAAQANITAEQYEEMYKRSVADPAGFWAEQAEQLGTGHAVAQGLHALSDEGTALVLYGDVPLTRLETLQRLLAQVDANSLALLTVELDDAARFSESVDLTDGQYGAIACLLDETGEEGEEIDGEESQQEKRGLFKRWKKKKEVTIDDLFEDTPETVPETTSEDTVVVQRIAAST